MTGSAVAAGSIFHVERMCEHVATVDIWRMVENLIHNRDDVSWRMNANFQNPGSGWHRRDLKNTVHRSRANACSYARRVHPSVDALIAQR